MYRCAAAALLMGALTLTSCGFGGEESAGPGITGTWRGSDAPLGLIALNQVHPMTLILGDTAGRVIGFYQCLSAGAGNEPCPLGPAATDTPLSGDNAIRIAGSSEGGFIAAIEPDPNNNASCQFQAAYSDVIMDGIYTCTNGETGTFRLGKDLQ